MIFVTEKKGGSMILIMCGIIFLGGGVAQLVRACVLYTQSPWFESTHPYHLGYEWWHGESFFEI